MGVTPSSSTSSTTPAPVATTPAAGMKRDWKTWSKVALLVGFWAWWVWFFPDTVPGKALLKATNLSEKSDWYGWVMQYVPSALMVWLGWRIIFATPATGGGKTTEKKASPVGLTILGLVVIGLTVMVSQHYFGSKGLAVDEAPVSVPMIHQVGGKERVWVPIGSIMVHVTRPNKAGDGSTIYFDCGSVIEPSALANAPEMKGVQIENTTVNAQYKNELRFTKEVREYLASQHIRLVLVEFEQREGAYRDVRTDCPHTRW